MPNINVWVDSSRTPEQIVTVFVTSEEDIFWRSCAHQSQPEKQFDIETIGFANIVDSLPCTANKLCIHTDSLTLVNILNNKLPKKASSRPLQKKTLTKLTSALDSKKVAAVKKRGHGGEDPVFALVDRLTRAIPKFCNLEQLRGETQEAGAAEAHKNYAMQLRCAALSILDIIKLLEDRLKTPIAEITGCVPITCDYLDEVATNALVEMRAMSATLAVA